MRLGNLAGRATVVLGERALDVEQASAGALSGDPMVLADLAVHPRLRELAATAYVAALPALDTSRLGPPVPRPGQGYGVALNYRSHALEAGAEIPGEPALFAKQRNCVVGPYDDIVVPAACDQVDYEAELVIVFGRDCKRVAQDEAWDVLAGVTVGQDVSDRFEQRRPPVRQFTVAKSYDTFGPIGPYLVTPDELADRDALDLGCRIDGQVMQKGRTDDLIFSVPQIVAWLTRYITFRPGDLVWTGTPSGVGVARSPQFFLRDGMVIETWVDGIGQMRNRVVVR